MNQAEKTLVEGLRAGRAESFEVLLRQYSGRLLATATRIMGNTQDAEDVLQDSFITAWRAIAQFDGASSLYTWLHRIVVNGCLTKLRSSRANVEISMAAPDRSIALPFEGIPPAWSEPGPSLEKRLAMRRSIEKALRSMPEDLRTVLLLRDVEGLSSQETAQITGISDVAVRQRLHRARTAMAELLRPELCDGPELTCGGDLDLLLDYIDNVLSPDLQDPVHQHMASCEACGNLHAIYRATIGIPRAIVELTADEPTEQFVQRTLRMLPKR